MDIRLEIEQELWEAIEKNYKNESYSSAILDAMHLLTETIRNKTGLEGDGVSLVGQAFGGENPRIQLNKLQTDSEKNIQRGTQEILKGLYTAIRNSRSHDKIEDAKQEADAIISFIDYLLRIIDKSKISFEEETFLQRVFDELYVATKGYSDLLVLEIPKRQRANIAISVILRRTEGEIYNLGYFMTSLFDKLEEAEITRIYKVISDELKITTSDADIRTILHICPAKYWRKIDKVVRMRIENLLKRDVEAGTYDSEHETCGQNGALGTWIQNEHLIYFEDVDVDDWTRIIVNKLESGNEEEIAYVDKYFWSKICSANHDEINFYLKRFISKGLREKNEMIVKNLESEIQFEKDHPWWKVFEEELKIYPEIQYVELPF